MKLNHSLILTTDLEAMNLFWTKAIGLTIGDRPPFPFKGEWFYSEGKPLIHIAEQNNIDPQGGAIAHVALEGGNYNTLIYDLKRYNYKYTEKDVPVSGEHQVFVAGPDGLMVEMIFPLGTSDDKAHP
jgi:lactoylglutathione lyase